MGIEHPHLPKVAIWHPLRNQEIHADEAAPPFAEDLSWAEVIARIHQVMTAFATTKLARQGDTGDEEHDA
jgi:hypothetical protein